MPPPSSSSSTPTTTTTTMRVLCLHGASHSGCQFRIELQSLERRLFTNHGIELVYVDSPLCHDGRFALEVEMDERERERERRKKKDRDGGGSNKRDDDDDPSSSEQEGGTSSSLLLLQPSSPTHQSSAPPTPEEEHTDGGDTGAVIQLLGEEDRKTKEEVTTSSSGGGDNNNAGVDDGVDDDDEKNQKSDANDDDMGGSLLPCHVDAKEACERVKNVIPAADRRRVRAEIATTARPEDEAATTQQEDGGEGGMYHDGSAQGVSAGGEGAVALSASGDNGNEKDDDDHPPVVVCIENENEEDCDERRRLNCTKSSSTELVVANPKTLEPTKNSERGYDNYSSSSSMMLMLRKWFDSDATPVTRHTAESEVSRMDDVGVVPTRSDDGDASEEEKKEATAATTGTTTTREDEEVEGRRSHDGSSTGNTPPPPEDTTTISENVVVDDGDGSYSREKDPGHEEEGGGGDEATHSEQQQQHQQEEQQPSSSSSSSSSSTPTTTTTTTTSPQSHSTPSPILPPSPSPTTRTKLEYVGLDASLFHLLQVWNRERRYRPFRGILAFDQGAALAGLLPLIMLHDPHFMVGLDFMVLSSGYVLDPPPDRGCMMVPPELHLEEEGIVDFLSTLHLIRKDDPIVPMESSRRLARRFSSARVYEYKVGGAGADGLDEEDKKVRHSFPTRPKDLNVIGRFLVEQKNDLMAELGSNAEQIFETQRQLLQLEQHATDVVTKALGNNPPKALMAIISPQAVGGWMGPKLRDPTDGGGAPCPAEFVMKKEERSSAPAAASSGGRERQGQQPPPPPQHQHDTAGGTCATTSTNDSEEKGSAKYRDASREHPKAAAAAPESMA